MFQWTCPEGTILEHHRLVRAVVNDVECLPVIGRELEDKATMTELARYYEARIYTHILMHNTVSRGPVLEQAYIG